MKDRFGVVATVRRSAARFAKSTSLAWHSGDDVIPAKYTNGLCRVAYWLPSCAARFESRAPGSGWRHGVPISSMYPFQVFPAALNWPATVCTDSGYTQPRPFAWPSDPVPLESNGS